jgi:ribosomal-protein-alanine N-acetyltransferase
VTKIKNKSRSYIYDIPSNIRSGKLLDKLGFQKEGVAKSYLKIAGPWQDHVLTSKLNSSYYPY